jgi:nucleotide-binding universal stress UspA family protein
MRVLVAIDGSPDASNAVDWVRHLPLPADAMFRVVSVLSVSACMPDLDAAAWHVVRRAAEGVVDDTRRRLGGPPVENALLEGDPREAIPADARRWGADLIVLGARGLGAVKEFLLGSVSLGVARHAPCSVVVCKGSPRDVRTITIAYDGSLGASEAITFVTGLRLPHHTHLRLIGVAEAVRYPFHGPGILGQTMQAATAAVEAERKQALAAKLIPAVSRLWTRVATVDSTANVGTPASEILRYADVTETDLLVLGARGLGTMSRLLLGSVSETVLRHAHCPVLIVRERVQRERPVTTARAGSG